MKRVNAVVIGAGAAGGIVAKELATAGLSVVLLERGKWYTPSDCRKDDLRNQRTTFLGNAFGPEDEGNPRVWVDKKGVAHTVLPSEGAYQNNAACVGGGTLSYGAQAWRYMPQDFRMRSTYGAPAGSSLEDWPITYDDLEPFYEKAEYEIGVSGDYSGTPFHGPRRRDLPMPPLPPNREFDILEPAAKRLGLHPFHLPMLRNSVPYNGRGPCMRCRWCCGFACEVDAKNGTQNTVIPVALNTGNCELRTECMAKEILTDDRGRATRRCLLRRRAVSCSSSPADMVIVSSCRHRVRAPAAEFHAAAVPQRSGQSLRPGRPKPAGPSLHAAPSATSISTHMTMWVPAPALPSCDYNHGTPGLCGGGMLANGFIRLPIQMIDRMPPNTPRWGLAHKQAMRALAQASIVRSWGRRSRFRQQPARVTLDPTVRDKWGSPVARIRRQRASAHI